MNFGFETIFVDCDHPNNLSVEDRLSCDLLNSKKIMNIKDHELKKIADAMLSSMQVLKGQSLDTQSDFKNDVLNNQDLLVEKNNRIHRQAVDTNSCIQLEIDGGAGRRTGLPDQYKHIEPLRNSGCRIT